MEKRLAPLIWERLGNPTVYVEPFAGSLACLLARPTGGGAREIVCDLDGGIANFWRAVEADPDAVAYWADHPSIHQDLTARHKWLKAWFAENSHVMSEDPFFYDAQVAGFWVWGISLVDRRRLVSRPVQLRGNTHEANSGQDLQSGAMKGGTRYGAAVWQRADQIPMVPGAYGNGVSAQRKKTPGGANEIHVTDQIPRSKWPGGGQGVSAQRPKTPGGKVEHNTPDQTARPR